MPRSKKVALITGISGQDGSYLAELLLRKRYDVIGLIRPGTVEKLVEARIWREPNYSAGALQLIEADLLNRAGLMELLRATKPNEVYHLAAPSHVGQSFADPANFPERIERMTATVFEAAADVSPQAKLFHASSAEVFGNAKESPQTEMTPFSPVSPYGLGKAAATDLVHGCRAGHELFACNGILYNHESPRRGENFVTQKIARGVAAIVAGQRRELRLGDLESRRDWGHAKDFVRAMWMMLQASTPDDYIIATGETHSVLDFVAEAFSVAGLEWRKYVVSDPMLRRSADPQLVGNSGKIRTALGWEPEYNFTQIVREMVEAAIQRISH